MDKRVFVFGEEHDKNPETLSYVRESMRMLKERGVKNIAFELPQDWQGEFVRAAQRGDKTLSMKVAGADEVLRRSGLDGASTKAPSQHLELASEAMNMGLKVHCVDLPAIELMEEVPKMTRAVMRGERGRVEKVAERIEKAGGEVTPRDVKETRAILTAVTLGASSTLGRRNAHMAEQIDKIEGDTILLTGMLHTGGRNGVDQHLRRRGMSVVTTDIFPKNSTLLHEVHQAVENPRVDFRAMGVSQPSQNIIEAKIAAIAPQVDRAGETKTPTLRKAPSLPIHTRPGRGDKRRTFDIIAH